MKKGILFLVMLTLLLVMFGCSNEVQQFRDGELKYEGTVNSEGIREGKGKWYQNGILVYEGEYRDDYPNGKGIMYDSITGKKSSEGEYEDSYLIKGVTYDDNGENPTPYP
ncbi:hypothetical protein [Planomicrobium okeanokoites]|uniref:hypothetical protein n=1 Tax=Planomicrobium okeanokoites TaxID=244 RepID=UPI000A04FEEF|nr:hypothetical protein [Planomicrobium okeanokoites]